MLCYKPCQVEPIIGKLMTVEADPKTSKKNLSRDDWISAARHLLITSGIGSVRVRRLASFLKVTTGAFYWQFKDLEELLVDLRDDWAVKNTKPFTQAIECAGPDGWARLLAINRMVLLEEEYDPDYDTAIRSWSEISKETEVILHKIDAERIELIREIYTSLGFTGRAAEIRANVHYLHQVGYQALRIRWNTEERLKNLAYYTEMMTGNKKLLELGGPDAVLIELLSIPISAD